MTKQEVSQRIAEQTGLDPLMSKQIIEAFFEVVKESLTLGEPTYIRHFGSFILKQRAQKTARHISQNTALTVAAHVAPAFKASPDFMGRVRARGLPVEAR